MLHSAYSLNWKSWSYIRNTVNAELCSAFCVIDSSKNHDKLKPDGRPLGFSSKSVLTSVFNLLFFKHSLHFWYTAYFLNCRIASNFVWFWSIQEIHISVHMEVAHLTVLSQHWRLITSGQKFVMPLLLTHHLHQNWSSNEAGFSAFVVLLHLSSGKVGQAEKRQRKKRQNSLTKVSFQAFNKPLTFKTIDLYGRGTAPDRHAGRERSRG